MFIPPTYPMIRGKITTHKSSKTFWYHSLHSTNSYFCTKLDFVLSRNVILNDRFSFVLKYSKPFIQFYGNELKFIIQYFHDSIHDIHDSFFSLFLPSCAPRPNCTLRWEFPNSKKILKKLIRNRID